MRRNWRASATLCAGLKLILCSPVAAAAPAAVPAWRAHAEDDCDSPARELLELVSRRTDAFRRFLSGDLPQHKHGTALYNNHGIWLGLRGLLG